MGDRKLVILAFDDGWMEYFYFHEREIEKKGHIVHSFISCRDLLDELKYGLSYDVALIDRAVELGIESRNSVSGDDLMTKLKGKYPNRPIISISAYNEKAPHADKHIKKPCGVDELLRILEKVAKEHPKTL